MSKKTKSEAGFSELYDEQDLKTTNITTKKILKSSNPINPNADNLHKGDAMSLPNGWEMKKLGEVCSYDKTPNKRNDLLYVGLEDIQSNTGKFIGTETPKSVKSSTFYFNTNHVLYSRLRPYLNKVLLPQFEGHCSTEIFPIKPKNNLVLREYLYWWLISNETMKKIDATWTGATLPRANMNTVLEFKFSFPNCLAHQQRIVAYLDQTFAKLNQAKANTLQNLQNAKELFETELRNVFENGFNNEGWIEKTLGELGTITSSKRIYKSEYVNEGVPFYRTKEIKEISNGKNLTLELFISRDRYNEIKKTFGVPQINDLLMSAVGTIGEIMVIKNNDEFYFKDGNIVWFKGFKELETDYLKYALTAFVEKIKSLAIGSAYSALTIEKLNLYKLSFPKSLQTQQEIVAKLDALKTQTQQLESVYQTKLHNIEELRSGILKRAFEGQMSEPLIIND